MKKTLGRGALATALALALSVVLFALSASAATPPGGVRRYVVTRNGSTIGRHVIRFQPSEHGVVVEHQIRILVKVLFVTAYRYEADRTETWESDHLVSLRAHANDNGTPRDVVAASAPDGLEVKGGAGTAKAGASVIVGAGWNMLTAGKRQMIDTDSGKLLDVNVSGPTEDTLTLGGRPLKCQSFDLSGGQQSTLWFGPDGALVKERLRARDGSWVETTLE